MMSLSCRRHVALGLEYDFSGSFTLGRDHNATRCGLGVFHGCLLHNGRKLMLQIILFPKLCVQLTWHMKQILAFSSNTQRIWVLSMVNHQPPFGSWKKCGTCKLPRRPPLGQFFNVLMEQIQASPPGFSQPFQAFNHGMPSGLLLMKMGAIQGHCLPDANTSGMCVASLVRIQKATGSQDQLHPILPACANTLPTLWSPSCGKGGTTRLASM